MKVDRSIAPDFQIPEKISLTQPKKRVLPNGIPLYYIHTPTIDVVKIELVTAANRQLQLT